MGNNPLNNNDPTGNCPSCIGGLINVAVGIGVNLYTGVPITSGTLGVDFLTGAAGVGLISRLNQLSTIGRIGIAAEGNAALFGINQTTKNTIDVINGNLPFSVDGFTSQLTPGNFLVSGLVPLPFSNVGKNIAGNAPELTTSIFERSMVEFGFQTGIDIPLGIGGSEAAGFLNSFGSTNPASGGFVLYPNKINNNFIERVYSK